VSAPHIAAGTPLHCPYCTNRVSLPHCVDGHEIIRCKCGGIASASLWAKHAELVTAALRRMN